MTSMSLPEQEFAYNHNDKEISSAYPAGMTYSSISNNLPIYYLLKLICWNDINYFIALFTSLCIEWLMHWLIHTEMYDRCSLLLLLY